MPKRPLPALQTTQRNNFLTVTAPTGERDTVGNWLSAYLECEVTTAPSSQAVQRRDLMLFRTYMLTAEGTEERARWSPRLTKSFQSGLRAGLKDDGTRRWSDVTVNRIIAHLKTFAKWVHKLAPFPLGEPTAKVKGLAVPCSLQVERAITAPERRRLLDAADVLVEIGGRSKDRTRHKDSRPRRASYRPYRNRAILYLLIETGMRRAAVTTLRLADIDPRRRIVTAEEKGGVTHGYHISQEGLAAVLKYVEMERPDDAAHFGSPLLFLTARENPHGRGALSPCSVNEIWNEIAATAGVAGRTPHSARHAMGLHIMEKTGNVAAVQRQLGHRNPAYSMQYARVTAETMRNVLDDRE